MSCNNTNLHKSLSFPSRLKMIENHKKLNKINSMYSKRESTIITSDLEKEFTDLTLSIEREILNQTKSSKSCFKCFKPIASKSEAFHIDGNLIHLNCFSCHACGRSLKNKSFYKINNKIYCEEDYFYSGFLDNIQKCFACSHGITEKILYAVGKTYHPNCFRCTSCNQCLDGLPFTLDSKNRVYCIEDFFIKYAPKCSKCKIAITPANGK